MQAVTYLQPKFCLTMHLFPSCLSSFGFSAQGKDKLANQPKREERAGSSAGRSGRKTAFYLTKFASCQLTFLSPGLAGISVLFLLLCSCAGAPPTVTSVVGSVRYDATDKLLSAELAVSPTPTSGPTFFGSEMPLFTAAGPGHYRGRRTLPFTSPIQFTLPCAQEPAAGCALELPFVPPVADNIPDSINLGSTLRFQAAPSGLLDNENLIAFFEPDDRSDPQRILLQGPTDSGRMTIPKEAMVDFVPGAYHIYLIKQQLYQDSLPTLVTSIQTEYFTRSVPVVVY